MRKRPNLIDSGVKLRGLMSILMGHMHDPSPMVPDDFARIAVGMIVDPMPGDLALARMSDEFDAIMEQTRLIWRHGLLVGLSIGPSGIGPITWVYRDPVGDEYSMVELIMRMRMIGGG